MNSWKIGKDAIHFIVSDYFDDMFRSAKPTMDHLAPVLGTFKLRLSSGSCRFLDSRFLTEEIIDQFLIWHRRKRQAPMVSLPCFTRSFGIWWGSHITTVCLSVLNDGVQLDGINKTLITLIPKALANRLRSVLNKVISETQSAIMPGRLITDNTIIGFECMHTLKRRKKGFSHAWIDRIMNCMRSVSFSFLVNGEARGSLTSSRGLRQGDPLSPYLFLICTEGLSCLIRNAEERRDLAGFKCSKPRPKISHLFFPDDSMIFTRASVRDCHAIKNVLDVYSRALGQRVNFQKSAMCVSGRVSRRQALSLARIIGVQLVECHE
ncbi:hypothetical protein Dsin_001998 [Dipteronia sinensis]|uniref:Reverse transcriptase domain-containing protein n=1 Tax=Dipteronia sinensis TaxID=43782 RepID=A0AAE0B5B1_9ROSI|nr:hypothetical protein Dsin_001998 [Dipteronia sinensis]